MTKVAVETDAAAEVREAVGRGLTAYNDRFLPRERERTPVVLSARDADGSVVGGLVGELRLDWLYVDWLWVDEQVRGEGHGEALMRLAEDSARQAGCTHIHLWTWSFQAPEFYPRLGYREFGRLADHPNGHDMVMFCKNL